MTREQTTSQSSARTLAGVIALVAASAVIVQLSLNIERLAAEGRPAWMAVVDLFGYFTIWSNTLVALVTVWFARGGDKKRLLGRPWLLAATMVYIIVVGLIYNVLLLSTNPQVGVRKVVDLTLHTVVPIAYTLWWLTQIQRGQLNWKALLPALVFPLAYCLVAMTKGTITGKYAYFFIDIGKYGLPQVLLNSAGLAALYALLMAVVIAFDRRGGGTIAPDPD